MTAVHGAGGRRQGLRRRPWRRCRCARWTASTWRSARASCSRSSALPGPASRRCWRSWAGWPGRRRAPSASTATTSRSSRIVAWPGCGPRAWGSCSSSSTWSAAAARWRTSPTARSTGASRPANVAWRPRPAWPRSASPTAPATARALLSGRRAPARRDRARAGRRPGAWSWPTSPRATSTPRPAPRSSASCAPSTKRAARSWSSPTTRRSRATFPRTIVLRDGRVVADTAPPPPSPVPITLRVRSPAHTRVIALRVWMGQRREAVSADALPRPRLRARDLVAVGTVGLRSRPARTLLTALGVAIGVAAVVAVLGISASSRADLLATLDELGTNLLVATPGNDIFGERQHAPRRGLRHDPPHRPGRSATSATTRSTRPSAQRPRAGDAHQRPRRRRGRAVAAGDPCRPSTRSAGASSTERGRQPPGHRCSAPPPRLRLGITDLDGRPRVWVDGEWYAVVGILEPLALAPRAGRGGADHLPGRGALLRHRDLRPRRSTCAPTLRTSTRSHRRAAAHGQPRGARRGRRHAAPPTRWRPAPRSTPRSRACSSAWAPWRWPSAASGSRT